MPQRFLRCGLRGTEKIWGAGGVWWEVRGERAFSGVRRRSLVWGWREGRVCRAGAQGWAQRVLVLLPVSQGQVAGAIPRGLHCFAGTPEPPRPHTEQRVPWSPEARGCCGEPGGPGRKGAEPTLGVSCGTARAEGAFQRGWAEAVLEEGAIDEDIELI